MSSDHSQKTLYRKIVLVVTLAAVWLLWSGLYKFLLISLGVFSCAITFIVAQRMEYFQDRFYALSISARYVRYFFWLGKEIITSSIDVARIVLDPKLPISPTIVEIQSTAEHPVDQVTLGNSITLTPGTLTLDLYKGVMRVHALTERGAQDLLAGEMDRRVSQLRTK